MNILILSAGTRNKIVQYFKEEAGSQGRVVATDCSNLAPAVYQADAFYLVPRITAPGYLERILEICVREKIGGVFSLIDPELSLLAKERDKFTAIGTIPIISPYELVETCFDKFRMYRMLTEMGIPTGRCYLDKDAFYQDVEDGKISYPVFVKPVRGSASIHISKVSSQKEIEVLFGLYDDLMVQEYMDGQEYGADVYIDMLSGKCTSVFLKKKIKMRAGETDKSISVKIPALFGMIQRFVEKCGFRGMIDIDIFEVGGKFYLSEVNPRFGGGYPHAHACGVNMPRQVVNNLSGKVNTGAIGEYQENICMMKYNEMVVKDFHGEEIVE
ncbi:carbamoyl-phosphate synthase arginine-specific large chain [Lachnospiraceae bacterium]|nr:carbamoyl-phosphate synthase arginine-specific large chain [Lachnospiraceae bacterium]